jgi:hypothetical protein
MIILGPVVVGGIARDLTTDITHNGMLLPKGSIVLVHFYSMVRRQWHTYTYTYIHLYIYTYIHNPIHLYTIYYILYTAHTVQEPVDGKSGRVRTRKVAPPAPAIGAPERDRDPLQPVSIRLLLTAQCYLLPAAHCYSLLMLFNAANCLPPVSCLLSPASCLLPPVSCLLPTASGKRQCLGQNMAMFQLRAVAAHFLHFFDFELQVGVICPYAHMPICHCHRIR